MDPGDARAGGAGCGDEGVAGGEVLERRGVDDVFVAAGAGAGVGGPGAEELVVDALRVNPDGSGAGDGGDELGGVGDVLAVCDQGADVSEDLVAQLVTRVGAQVGELLGGQETA